MSDATARLLAVDLKAIEEAAERVRDVAWRTPLVPASRDEDGRLLMKMEALQRTGSFKIRGAWNRMSRATMEERARGFVTVSAGNHGQAVAWSARKLGAPCTVWVPEGAVRRKVESMESMGAVVRTRPHEEIMDAMRTTELPFADGATYVHPFGDPLVLAGQGTVGLEVARSVGDVGTVLVPVGGGGLSSGVATAVKAVHPRAKVYGVQAEGAAPLPRSFASGHAEDVGAPKTFADGMAATRVFDYMWPVLRARLDGAFAVSDDELRRAVVHLAKESHVVAEGAGAAGLAAAWKHRAELAEPIVCVVSGGNLDAALLGRFLSEPS
ncbi:MAG TPA: pyridoxal-phosphate dependent enzyme [Candidatus Thermoplasmatota archaeon]|nr:pyridoxal-phosphate dependent enzyme [Candidatus Thermoplasmatota archaeon]